MQPNSPISKKKRLLIAAGIFLLPVIAIAVAVFGLMGAHKKSAQKRSPGSAFNTELPAPNLPKKEKNKLEMYMQAEQDSIKQKEDRAKDPYGKGLAGQPATPALPGKPVSQALFSDQEPRTGVVTSPFADDNDKKVADRLQKLYAALGSSGSTDLEKKTPLTSPSFMQQGESPEAAKLEKLMQAFQKTDTATSPQLQQVKQVLDEIKDIQHPERPIPGNTPGAAGVRSLPVDTHPTTTNDSDGQAVPADAQNGFFGLGDEGDSSVVSAASIQAVVHGSQIVQSGSIVKLRLLQPIYVGGQKIPANAFIYGPATISGERVSIQLTNAIYDEHIYPISLKVYDGVDGLEGLYVPGMITRDVVKQNMSQGINGLNLGSLDPSLGAQAASAAIETTRNLLSRKISIIKATLKSGHLAILKSNDNQR